MKKDIVNYLRRTKSELADRDPTKGDLLGVIEYPGGEVKEIYDNKAGALELLTIQGQFLEVDGRTPERVRITQKGLKNAQMAILWQVTNGKGYNEIKNKKEYYYSEV